MLLWCLLPFALLYWFSMASIYIICHVSPSWCIGDIPCQLFVTRRAVLGSQHLCSLTAWAWLALCDWKMDGTFSCATLKMHKAWPCISEASLTMNTQKDKRLHIPDVIKAFVVFQHSTCQTYFMSESYCLIMVIDMLPSLIDAVWYFTVMATIFSFFSWCQHFLAFRNDGQMCPVVTVPSEVLEHLPAATSQAFEWVWGKCTSGPLKSMAMYLNPYNSVKSAMELIGQSCGWMQALE